MCAAAGDEGMRPGMVAVNQTAGDLGNWHPHVHALASHGGWSQGGEWIPVAFVDERSAELLFRLKVTEAPWGRDGSMIGSVYSRQRSSAGEGVCRGDDTGRSNRPLQPPSGMEAACRFQGRINDRLVLSGIS